MERINFYENLCKKALGCANSGDLSDDYDILYDFFVNNEETIAKFGFEVFFDPGRQLISFSCQDVDETSQTLLPPDARGLIPIKYLGYGNYSSLRHVASLGLTLKVEITSSYPKIDNPCVRRDDLNFIVRNLC